MPSPFSSLQSRVSRGTSRYSGQVSFGRFPNGQSHVGKKKPQAGVVSAWGM